MFHSCVGWRKEIFSGIINVKEKIIHPINKRSDIYNWILLILKTTIREYTINCSGTVYLDIYKL
jgi:hypothetical protein